MQVVQINSIEFEDLLDGVYKLGKRLDKIDEKLSGKCIEYVPTNLRKVFICYLRL